MREHHVDRLSSEDANVDSNEYTAQSTRDRDGPRPTARRSARDLSGREGLAVGEVAEEEVPAAIEGRVVGLIEHSVGVPGEQPAIVLGIGPDIAILIVLGVGIPLEPQILVGVERSPEDLAIVAIRGHGVPGGEGRGMRVLARARDLADHAVLTVPTRDLGNGLQAPEFEGRGIAGLRDHSDLLADLEREPHGVLLFDPDEERLVDRQGHAPPGHRRLNGSTEKRAVIPGHREEVLTRAGGGIDREVHPPLARNRTTGLDPCDCRESRRDRGRSRQGRARGYRRGAARRGGA